MRIVSLAFGAALAAAVAASPALAQAPAAAQPAFDVTKVDEGVYKFRYGGHNSMFLVTSQGVIVTDPISLRRPEAARAYLAEIRKITPAPIRYVIYTIPTTTTPLEPSPSRTRARWSSPT